jgi:thermospermine synthase
MPNMPEKLWILEEFSEDVHIKYRINKVLAETISPFQKIQVVENSQFGLVLMLDELVQSCEKDEFIYHEYLCHPALLHHPNPRSVFILGGGEGSTAREVLRHPSVERVVMCDIDAEVVKCAKRFFPVNAAAFEDPRLRLEIADAGAQIAQEGRFDVIISDLADPLAGGPCYQLFTQEFFTRLLNNHLNPGGLFVTQSCNAGPLTCQEVFTTIHHTLRQVFPMVVPYADYIPSFADLWSWCVCFSDPAMTVLGRDEFEARIHERGLSELQYLDGAMWQGATVFNKITRQALEQERHVMTLDNPAFVYGHGNVA